MYIALLKAAIGFLKQQAAVVEISEWILFRLLQNLFGR